MYDGAEILRYIDRYRRSFMNIKKGILECVRMMAKLKLALGDRKIDVIGDYEDNPVVKEALLTGIRLV